MSSKPRLVAHVGHGKTGSSSIQSALRMNASNIRGSGILYAGVMLENCQVIYDWQKGGGSDRFFLEIPEERASKQLQNVLQQAMATAENEAVHTVIWSNEWIFPRGSRVIPALLAVAEQGYEVEIQCYVRSHDSWLRSAYIQWGIKNKTYRGPVKTFREWEAGQDLSFAKHLGVWHNVFGDNFSVYNYDTKDDVVDHFFSINGVPTVKKNVENASPPLEELSAWAAFNSQFERCIKPKAFEELLMKARAVDDRRVLQKTIEDLLPDAECVEYIREKYGADFADVNRFLKMKGEDPLGWQKSAAVSRELDPQKHAELLYRLLIALHDELEQVRSTRGLPSRSKNVPMWLLKGLQSSWKLMKSGRG